MLYFLIGFFSGLAIGLILYFILKNTQQKQEQDLAIKFEQISQASIQKTQDQFFSIANDKFKTQSQNHQQGLDHKKALIDQTLQTVKKELEHVKTNLQNLESNHQKRLGEMTSHLSQHRMTTQQLMETTTELKEALASSKTRGQWGERMAEDVLRFSGFVEGVNYIKQRAIETTIPDFTFFLPKDKKIHMDVKFPLSNYMTYLNESNATIKESHKKQFVRDVRGHIKSITTRSYIANDTVDYVIVFIPNEQIYQFMHDHDPELIDYSLQLKVVLCSPITLYAILAIIRQAIDNFAIEHKAQEMMDILTNFQTQWDKYKVSMEKIGRRLSDAQKEYESLVTTRTNQLDRPLRRINELKKDQLEPSKV